MYTQRLSNGRRYDTNRTAAERGRKQASWNEIRSDFKPKEIRNIHWFREISSTKPPRIHRQTHTDIHRQTIAQTSRRTKRRKTSKCFRNFPCGAYIITKHYFKLLYNEKYYKVKYLWKTSIIWYLCSNNIMRRSLAPCDTDAIKFLLKCIWQNMGSKQKWVRDRDRYG